jgi:hypothetical protein
MRRVGLSGHFGHPIVNPAYGAHDYPVAQDLARHLRAHLGAAGFEGDNVPMGHGFAFIHSQLMPDPPIPVAECALSAEPPDTFPLH